MEEITESPEAARLDSAISHSDGISLLIFLDGQSVVRALEVPNRPTDFTRLDGECYLKEDAVFVVPDTGWPYARPADE